MGKLTARDFSLRDTLESGQVFRFSEREGWFFVQARDSLFKVRQDGRKLEFKGIREPALKRFLCLDHPISRIKRDIRVDDHVSQAVDAYPGLRIMSQDPWECTVSFVCSQMSNIPKIKMSIALMSEAYGNEVSLDGFSSHTFPEPGSLKDGSVLRDCKVGFRAKYLQAVNERADASFFKGLGRMDYEDAKRELMSLPGIGDKVADCICLFSLGHLDAFPVDTWISKVMSRLYFSGEDVKHDRIREFASSRFNGYAGYAQQFLFHAVRNQKI